MRKRGSGAAAALDMAACCDTIHSVMNLTAMAPLILALLTLLAEEALARRGGRARFGDWPPLWQGAALGLLLTAALICGAGGGEPFVYAGF